MTKRTNQSVIEDLHELIAALDRRVSRLERAGEEPIARAAAALRKEATKRLAELEESPVDLTGHPAL